MEVSFKIQLLKNMGLENASNSNPNLVDLVNLVRSIQRAEGHIDCYRRGLMFCNRMDCAWRDHCSVEPEELSKTDMADEIGT